MRKRKSSKKGLIAVVGSLSALTLVSVGFASWVITSTDTTSVEGQIDVDTVEDHRFVIANKSNITSSLFNTVVFGAPSAATGTAASKWLSADGEKIENLDPVVAADNKIDVYVQNIKTSDLATTHFQVSLTADAGYATAVTATYVAALPTATFTFVEVMASGDYQGCGHIKVHVDDFEWGAYFGGNNPFTYYNDGVKTANGEAASGHGTGTWADDAKTSLTALKNALNEVKYTLTISTLA